MVKDQYANYVIQKIIQTCTADQREMLLSRIRVHLNSLKKYTYGKHIVARFEQLYGEGLLFPIAISVVIRFVYMLCTLLTFLLKAADLCPFVLALNYLTRRVSYIRLF